MNKNGEDTEPAGWDKDRVDVLEDKIDKLLIILTGLVGSHVELVEQQAEIIEKLGNITISGEGFSYGSID